MIRLSSGFRDIDDSVLLLLKLWVVFPTANAVGSRKPGLPQFYVKALEVHFLPLGGVIILIRHFYDAPPFFGGQRSKDLKLVPENAQIIGELVEGEHFPNV